MNRCAICKFKHLECDSSQVIQQLLILIFTTNQIQISSQFEKLHTRNAKVSPVAEGCPIKRTFIRGGVVSYKPESYSRCTDGRTDRQTDWRTKGNPISPFCNFVATGDKNPDLDLNIYYWYHLLFLKNLQYVPMLWSVIDDESLKDVNMINIHVCDVRNLGVSRVLNNSLMRSAGTL